jgi:hypothetical protein
MFNDIRLEVGIGRWVVDILLRWPLRTLRRCAPGFWGCFISLFSVRLCGVVTLCNDMLDAYLRASLYTIQCLYRSPCP